MSKTKFVYPILIALLCVTCGQKKTNLDSQFGSIRDAKGYYNEGDKKFKIFKTITRIYQGVQKMKNIEIIFFIVVNWGCR